MLKKLDSDHLPVLVSIWATPLANEAPKIKIDWGIVTETLGENVFPTPKEYSRNTVNQQVNLLTTCTQKSLERGSSKIANKHTKDGLPEEIKAVIIIKNRLRIRNRLTRDPTIKAEVNSLQRQIRHSIIEHQARLWEIKTERLTTSDNSIWRVAKKLRGE